MWGCFGWVVDDFCSGPLGRTGTRKRRRQGTFSKVVYRRTTRVFKQSHFLCCILYIEEWGFLCTMFQTIVNGSSTH